MKPFYVCIPQEHVTVVRAKLERRQAHVAVQDRVRYSLINRSFFRWMPMMDGSTLWAKKECSRNGKKFGEFFGSRWSRAKLFRLLGIKVPTTEAALELPKFIGLDHGEIGRFFVTCNPVSNDRGWLARAFTEHSTVTGRWSAKQPETTMTPLKLSILLWTAAQPGTRYLAPDGPDGVVSQSPVISAAGELGMAGLIELAPRGYKLTDKGSVFVEHLTKQPLPIQTQPTWVMPANGGSVKG